MKTKAPWTKAFPPAKKPSRYAEYRKAVRKWKKRPENQWCRIAHNGGGIARAVDCHHVRGRSGRLLMDERFWVPLCRRCHNRVKEDPNWAKAMGLLDGKWGQYAKNG